MRVRSFCLVIAFLFSAWTSIPVPAQGPAGLSIQVASSATEASAREEMARLDHLRLKGYIISAIVEKLGTVFRVRLGRFSSLASARAFGDGLQQRGVIRQYWVVNFNGPSEFEYTRSHPAPAAIPSRSKARPEPKRVSEISASPLKTSPKNAASVSPPAAPRTAERDPVWIPQQSTVTADLSRVYFADRDNGWAIGARGVVLRTSDGGKHWARQNSHTAISLSNIFFTDTKHGWILGGGTRGIDLRDLLNPEETLLLATADGGETWNRVPGVNALALQFTSARDGWAVGNYGSILRTSDGGATWQKVPLPNSLLPCPVQERDQVLAFSDLSFTSAQDGWVVGNRFSDRGSEAGVILHTSDGGSTWQAVDLPGPRSASGEVIRRLHHLKFFSPAVGILLADVARGKHSMSAIFATIDSGKTWQQRAALTKTLSALSMTDPLNGWAVTHESRGKAATVSQTRDGGRTWQEVFRSTQVLLHDVQTLDQASGWAVGENGSILRMSPKNTSVAAVEPAPLPKQ